MNHLVYDFGFDRSWFHLINFWSWLINIWSLEEFLYWSKVGLQSLNQCQLSGGSCCPGIIIKYMYCCEIITRFLALIMFKIDYINVFWIITGANVHFKLKLNKVSFNIFLLWRSVLLSIPGFCHRVPGIYSVPNCFLARALSINACSRHWY